MIANNIYKFDSLKNSIIVYTIWCQWVLAESPESVISIAMNSSQENATISHLNQL